LGDRCLEITAPDIGVDQIGQKYAREYIKTFKYSLSQSNVQTWIREKGEQGAAKKKSQSPRELADR
jgi:hypothetical protein